MKTINYRSIGNLFYESTRFCKVCLVVSIVAFIISIILFSPFLVKAQEIRDYDKWVTMKFRVCGIKSDPMRNDKAVLILTRDGQTYEVGVDDNNYFLVKSYIGSGRELSINLTMSRSYLAKCNRSKVLPISEVGPLGSRGYIFGIQITLVLLFSIFAVLFFYPSAHLEKRYMTVYLSVGIIMSAILLFNIYYII